MLKTYEMLKKNLYETGSTVSGYLEAAAICTPSYLSFDYALSCHGLIPEGAKIYTSATCPKRKKKTFRNWFGTYISGYPRSFFPFEIEIGCENERPFLMATPEKAICDKLCTVKPIRSRKHLQQLLFDDLRTDQDAFSQLDFSVLRELCPLYKWTTLTTLLKLTGTWQSDGSSL